MTSLTPASIERIGKLLFGSQYRHGLEDAFGLSPRYVRRLLAGSAEPSDGLVREIEVYVRDRANALDDVLEGFNG